MSINWRKWGVMVALACCLAGTSIPADAQYNVVAEQGYKRARTMASNERWDDALTTLKDVLKKAPNYPDALYLAGVCHLNKGDYVNAEKRLKRLTEVCKDFIGGWGMLAQVYLCTKEYGKIKDVIAGLGKVKGGKAEAHYCGGLVAYMQGQFDQAEREWRSAVRVQPDMAKAHYNLGSMMYTKGDKVRAMQGLRDALRYDPENPLYRYSLADLQLETGNKAEGMTNLDRCRQQTLRRDIAHLASARQMWANGHTEKAEKMAAQAITDNKDLSEAYLLRAKALDKMGKKEEALKNYKKALDGDPNYKEAKEAVARLSPKPQPAAPPQVTAPVGPMLPDEAGNANNVPASVQGANQAPIGPMPQGNGHVGPQPQQTGTPVGPMPQGNSNVGPQSQQTVPNANDTEVVDSPFAD